MNEDRPIFTAMEL